MKKALVLAGGGTRGIYQAGAIEALRELGEDDWNIITGTSVGALNACMLVQHDFDRMIDMYENIAPDQFINGFVPSDMHIMNLIRERDQMIPSFKQWVQQHGVDIRPLEQMVDEYYIPERFFASDIDFGAIAATAKGHEGVYITKDMMREHGRDWLLASAAAYPVFPIKVIEGKEYVDGGYFDNFPVDFALRLGAQRIIAIDLSASPRHPNYLDHYPVVYIHPHEELFNFLDFDHDKMRHARRIGYLDAMKKFGRYEGEKFTFEHFELDHYFDEWYLSLMKLETRIKLASNLNERFMSEDVISRRLRNQLHVTHLSRKQYLFGMVDVLMDMCGLDSEKVWTISEAQKQVLAQFAECVDENYAYIPQGVLDIASYVRTLDQKGITGKLLHAALYPDHRVFSDHVILTMYPFEQALAEALIMAMKQLAEV